MVYFSLHPMGCEGMAADYCAYVMLMLTMRNCDAAPLLILLAFVMVVMALLMSVMLISASLVAKVPGSAVMSPEAL